MCAEAHVGHSAAAMRSGAGRRSCVRGRGGVAAARGVRGMREGQRVDSPFLWLQRGDRGARTQALPRLPVLLNRNQRCACLQERLPQTQKKKKEAKVLALRNRLRKSGRRACKSARFKNAKEAKVLALRNRLRKSGRRACKKCSTQRTRTHRKYCHTELVYLVPQAHQNICIYRYARDAYRYAYMCMRRCRLSPPCACCSAT